MIARSLETRIVKLEASRRRPNELLVVWRRPGGDVKAAVSEAKFAPGDRVICLEWFGDGPLPAPRWHDKGLKFSGVEDDYLERAINRRIESRKKTATSVSRDSQNFLTSRPIECANCPTTICCTLIFGVAT